MNRHISSYIMLVCITAVMTMTQCTSASKAPQAAMSDVLAGQSADTTQLSEETAMADSIELAGAQSAADPVVSYDNAVDLGLSVRWASFNVGATRPEESGGYYAWGETEEKKEFTWYEYFDSDDGSCTVFKKYPKEKTDDLAPEDDVAHVKWRGAWRMPTRDEQDELRKECLWEWTSLNGVNGCRVTSKKNGNSIFLPAVGHRDGEQLILHGRYGDLWSSTPDRESRGGAYRISFVDNDPAIHLDSRCGGHTVRAVCP